MKIILPTYNAEKKPITIDGELEPEMPIYADNIKDYWGIDTNNNGVRDDVEIWINRVGANKDLRSALKQYARYLEKLGAANTKQDTVILKNKVYQSIACNSYVFNYMRNQRLKTVEEKIIDLIFNTTLRADTSKIGRVLKNKNKDNGYIPTYQYCEFLTKSL